MSEEYCILSLGRERPTDSTFLLGDSLHFEMRDYLIEGDGWKRLSKIWTERRQKLYDLSPLIVKESDEDYKELHDVFLTCGDYEALL